MNPDMKQANNALKEISNRLSALGICEKRDMGDEYCELVLYDNEIDRWVKIITDILGGAVKPPGTKANKEHLRLTEKYGSVYTGQTLFKKEFGDDIVIAMLWPWGNRTHTTIKIALLRK